MTKLTNLLILLFSFGASSVVLGIDAKQHIIISKYIEAVKYVIINNLTSDHNVNISIELCADHLTPQFNDKLIDKTEANFVKEYMNAKNRMLADDIYTDTQVWEILGYVEKLIHVDRKMKVHNAKFLLGSVNLENQEKGVKDYCNNFRGLMLFTYGTDFFLK